MLAEIEAPHCWLLSLSYIITRVAPHCVNNLRILHAAYDATNMKCPLDNTHIVR